MKEMIEAPAEIRKRIWMELSRAALDRHHEWRTPVLATTRSDGSPNARTLVLRCADERSATLSFYTDSRSEKMNELLAQPKAMLIFWSTRLNWQLRMRVSMAMQTTGAEVEAVWARVKPSKSAGDYLSQQAPGDTLADETALLTEPSEPTAHHHLALLTAHFDEIDWLELSRSGHRRARFSAESWEWLVP